MRGSDLRHDPAARSTAAGYSPNTLEVDLEAVAHNVREVRRVIGPRLRMFAVLKGNALGFGAVEVAKTALANGADSLSLVHIREAVRLREAGITAPILLYGGSLGDPDAVGLVEHYDLTAAVVDFESARLHSELAHQRIRVFVKVDAGLERLGVRAENAVEVIKDISRLPNLSLDGVFTHLHVDGLYELAQLNKDTPMSPCVAWQFSRFRDVVEQLQRAGVPIPVAMAASSPVVRLSPDMYLTGVDTGRLIYGLIPDVPPVVQMDLRPAFHSLKSRLIQVKDLVRSEFVAEAGFPIRAGMRIGIIPMGLADGLDMLTSGEVLVRGTRVKLIGIFYEHARLDLTDVPAARAGDEVGVIGEQAGSRISLEEVVRYQRAKLPAGLGSVAGLGSLVREGVRRVYLQPQSTPRLD
jgi:alanine racemase